VENGRGANQKFSGTKRKGQTKPGPQCVGAAAKGDGVKGGESKNRTSKVGGTPEGSKGQEQYQAANCCFSKPAGGEKLSDKTGKQKKGGCRFSSRGAAKAIQTQTDQTWAATAK